jgi:hypothetical protein
VVSEYKTGNARIKISDYYCRDKTPVEDDAILARVAN